MAAKEPCSPINKPRPKGTLAKPAAPKSPGAKSSPSRGGK
jgi:hypothetical protein